MFTIGNYNKLKIVKILSFGAYLDGGDGKEILLPTRYVPNDAKVDDEVEVFILDPITGRIMASEKVEKFLNNIPPQYKYNQEVDLLVVEDGEIGYKVIVNNLHWGMIYHNQVFQRLEKGEHLKGYVKEVRDDDKLDISLTPLGYQKVDGIAKVSNKLLVLYINSISLSLKKMGSD